MYTYMWSLVFWEAWHLKRDIYVAIRVLTDNPMHMQHHSVNLSTKPIWNQAEQHRFGTYAFQKSVSSYGFISQLNGSNILRPKFRELPANEKIKYEMYR